MTASPEWDFASRLGVIQVLIQRMTQNPTWSEPRIQAVLRLLGHQIAEATIVTYLSQARRR